MFKRHCNRTTGASDSDLVLAACRGSADAIGELYERHCALVYRFTLRMSGKALIAEEITQEVFLAFLRQPHQFQAEKGTFSTWLCGIARRQFWKRIEREESFVDIDAFEEQIDEEFPLGPYELLNRKDAVNAVRAGIEQLPLWLKEVIVLCELEELTYPQVSFILGVPIGTVRSRLHRAKARLAALICAESACAVEEKLL
jgi:RNA polymerase sigma-70 factor (ECF subfamily)